MKKNINKNESKNNVFLSTVIAGYLSDVLDTLKNHIDGIGDIVAVQEYVENAMKNVAQTVEAVYGRGEEWIASISENEPDGDIDLITELWWDIMEYGLDERPIASVAVDIPGGVESIGARPFSMNKSLTSVTIPSSVKSIGASAFFDCM